MVFLSYQILIKIFEIPKKIVIYIISTRLLYNAITLVVQCLTNTNNIIIAALFGCSTSFYSVASLGQQLPIILKLVVDFP